MQRILWAYEIVLQHSNKQIPWIPCKPHLFENTRYLPTKICNWQEIKDWISHRQINIISGCNSVPKKLHLIHFSIFCFGELMDIYRHILSFRCYINIINSGSTMFQTRNQLFRQMSSKYPKIITFQQLPFISIPTCVFLYITEFVSFVWSSLYSKTNLKLPLEGWPFIFSVRLSSVLLAISLTVIWAKRNWK